jgi:hypothetical protein
LAKRSTADLAVVEVTFTIEPPAPFTASDHRRAHEERKNQPDPTRACAKLRGQCSAALRIGVQLYPSGYPPDPEPGCDDAETNSGPGGAAIDRDGRDRSKTFKPRKTDLVISPENAQLHRRLHVRAMVRDGRRAFIGSQSLRRLELDERREIGLIIRDLGRHTAPELDRRPAYLGFHPEQAQQLLQR